MKKTSIKKILITLLIILGVQVLINNYVMADGAVPEQIANTTINSIADYNYAGKEIRPTIRIEQGYRVLVEGTDYTLAYHNNVNVGTASIQITGIGDYTGTVTKYFKINRKPINQLNVKVNNENYTYTGKERKTWVKIYNGNIKLVERRDHTLKYKNTVKTGKASVEIKLKGNYTGSVKKEFNIVQETEDTAKDIATLPIDNIENKIYTGKLITPELRIKDGENILEKNKDYTVKYSNNKEVGTATVTIANNKGSNLPSTGGMGTTIFYVVGSILVLGAAILLITKKRMSAR